MQPHDWIWTGPTGRLVAGEDVAVHLEAALAVLERDGWEPNGANPFGIFEALGGDVDLQRVAGRCIEFLLDAGSEAPMIDYVLWEAAPGRTFREIRNLLTVSARLARLYGPTPTGRSRNPCTS